MNTRPKVELGSPFLVERQSLQVRREAVRGEGKESWSNCLLFYTYRDVFSASEGLARLPEQGLKSQRPEPASQEGVLGLL